MKHLKTRTIATALIFSMIFLTFTPYFNSNFVLSNYIQDMKKNPNGLLGEENFIQMSSSSNNLLPGQYLVDLDYTITTALSGVKGGKCK